VKLTPFQAGRARRGPAGAVPTVRAGLHGACRAHPGARGGGGAAAEGHKATARPAVQGAITCYGKSRAPMKTRAGITDGTSGRATCSPSGPACGSRDRSSPHRGAPPQGAACPRAKARGCREDPGVFSGEATNGSAANTRGTRPAPCPHRPSLIGWPSLHGARRARRTRADLDRGLHKPEAHKPARLRRSFLHRV
jgi:hypothetical protein